MDSIHRASEVSSAVLPQGVARPSFRRGFAETLLSGNGIPLFFGGAVCLLILVLVAIVLLASFLVNFPVQSALSLGNYRAVLNSHLFFEVIPNTLLVGIGTVSVALAFGIPLAWLLHRTNLPYANLFLTLIAVSVIVPGFLKGIAWILLLSPRVGIINRFLMDVFA